MNGDEPAGTLPAPPPKVDPESLVLRGRPRPVVRFRRGVIIGGVTAVSASLVALTWFALEPATFRTVADSGSGRPFERAAPEAVAGAPRDYRDVPVLGPPLPGDLGRPIVDQQRNTAEAAITAPDAAPDAIAERAAAERQQRAQIEQAARTSSVVVQLSEDRAGGSQSQETARATVSEQAEATPAQGPTADKLQLGNWDRSDVNPPSLAPAASSWTVAAGTVIPASLMTALNSDLPGMVVAQVTENVRDSATGRAVLIPQGARLIGRYDSGIGYGQKRAFVVWQRILFPNGSSLRLDNMPASDAAGYAGLTDRVDGHSWQLIKGVVLSSLLGVGTQLSLAVRAALSVHFASPLSRTATRRASRSCRRVSASSRRSRCARVGPSGFLFRRTSFSSHGKDEQWPSSNLENFPIGYR